MRKRTGWEWRSREAGFLVLIELLIVVLIIAALAAFYLTSGGGMLGGGGTANPEEGATTVPGKAREQAESALCRNNLQQLRAAIQTQVAITGSYPSDLSGAPSGAATSCPVGGEQYDYDPSTGRVGCPHPGHEGY